MAKKLKKVQATIYPLVRIATFVQCPISLCILSFYKPPAKYHYFIIVSSLPMILSRQELLILFDASHYPKHRMILRLIYGSDLRMRRRELVNLRIRE